MVVPHRAEVKFLCKLFLLYKAVHIYTVLLIPFLFTCRLPSVHSEYMTNNLFSSLHTHSKRTWSFPSSAIDKALHALLK